MDMDFFNVLLGLDITTKTKRREYVRARQGVWLMLRCAFISYSKIGRIFGCSRQTVMEGCDSFEAEVKKDGDNIAKRYWALLEPHIKEYEE